MSESVLTADLKSELRKAIRERFDKDPNTYEDGLVAATLSIRLSGQGTIISAKQVELTRHEMNLFLPDKKKPATKPPTPRIEPKEEPAMRRSKLSDEQSAILEKFVQEHTGGEEGMTAKELMDEINKRKMVDFKIGVHVVNKIRKELNGAGSKKTAKKAAAAQPAAASAVPSEDERSILARALDILRAKRDAFSAAVETLEQELAK